MKMCKLGFDAYQTSDNERYAEPGTIPDETPTVAYGKGGKDKSANNPSGD